MSSAPKRVLITGANRGIGLALARQYLEAGWNVFATTRDPRNAADITATAAAFTGRLALHPLDVTDSLSVAALTAGLKGVPLDLLICNAGGLGRDPTGADLAAMQFGSLDYELWTKLLFTNTLGAVRVAEALTENLVAAPGSKIAFVSSTAGSIGEGKHPSLAYATAKTALNKAVTLIAEALRPRGVSVVALCPGRVKTRMGFQAVLTADDSAAGMRTVIEALSLENTGQFRRYNGEHIAW